MRCSMARLDILLPSATAACVGIALWKIVSTELQAKAHHAATFVTHKPVETAASTTQNNHSSNPDQAESDNEMSIPAVESCKVRDLGASSLYPFACHDNYPTKPLRGLSDWDSASDITDWSSDDEFISASMCQTTILNVPRRARWVYAGYSRYVKYA